MASFQVKKAKRELIWVKIALMAPSGGGKTFSALRLATGMKEELDKVEPEKKHKILMGNTEGARGRYYANEFDYDIVDLAAPHNPEMYVDFVNYAVEEGYDILLLDSSSHEWEGKGGCLELHQQAGGTYQSWAKVTPRHDKFILAIADSPIHVIATMRGKDQYEMEKSDNGKTNVKKLGVGAQQRNGFEYEFTATFLIDQKTNLASVQKDNTHLFENESDAKLTEADGKKLIKWANSGEGYTPPVRNSKSDVELIDDVRKQVITRCKELGGASNKPMMDMMKSKYIANGNPMGIKDIGKLKDLLKDLETVEPYVALKEEQKEEEK